VQIAFGELVFLLVAMGCVSSERKQSVEREAWGGKREEYSVQSTQYSVPIRVKRRESYESLEGGKQEVRIGKREGRNRCIPCLTAGFGRA
jgi:hypothetical protein